MKKLITLFVGLLFMGSATVMAADVTVSITIPDAAVPRVQSMIEADLNCGELTPPQCLKAELVRHIRYLVRTYEIGLINVQAKEDITAITDADVQ